MSDDLTHFNLPFDAFLAFPISKLKPPLKLPKYDPYISNWVPREARSLGFQLERNIQEKQ